MRNELLIYHRGLKGSENSNFLNEPGLACWTTCVRSLLIGSDKTNTGQQFDSYFSGVEATRFLTEIVAGLRSPMLGETEVHGQFKDFIYGIETDVSQNLYMELMSVHFLARKVRSDFLKNLGCQSYGSFARKKMKEVSELTIMGSGQLASEILPWLAKNKKSVNVVSRNPSKVSDEIKNMSNVFVQNYDSLPSRIPGLIITAPLSAQVIHDHLGNNLPELTLDFRAESRYDSLNKNMNVIALDDVFEEIEKQKNQVEDQVMKAKTFIAEKADDLESIVGRALKSIKVS